MTMYRQLGKSPVNSDYVKDGTLDKTCNDSFSSGVKSDQQPIPVRCVSFCCCFVVLFLLKFFVFLSMQKKEDHDKNVYPKLEFLGRL